MINILAFTGRNIKLFLRDKASVFFSFLSTLILIALYFLFIANIYSEAIVNNVPGVTQSGADFMVYLQMIAGVMVLNSMSLSLGMFSVAARDFETKKLDSFLITPAKKHELIISYYLSGLTVSTALNIFTWVISAVLIGILTGYWISAGAFFIVVGILAVCSVVSSSLMMLLTAIAKSSAALGVINGVAGTFIGFLSGIYMPYSNLGDGVKAVGSFLPFTHLTVWLKQTVLGDAFKKLNIEDSALKNILLDNVFSASGVGFAGLDAPLWAMLLGAGGFAIASLCLSWVLLKKRFRRVS